MALELEDVHVSTNCLSNIFFNYLNFHSKNILPLINKYSSIYTSIHSLCTNVKMCTLMCQHVCLSVYLYRITIESDKKIKPNDEHCYIPLGSSKLGRSSRCNCAICFVFWSQTLFTFLINTPAWRNRGRLFRISWKNIMIS